MYVCNILCALYNIHATHGKSIFFSAYMVFLCSLQFGSLRIWSSREHMWDLSNKLGQLPRIPGILYGSTCSGFHMDLLVLFMAIWTYSLSVMVKSLFWGGDTTLHFTVSHCDSTTLLNQAPTPKGLGRCGVLAGGVLCLRWQQQATTATSGEGSLPFMEAWDSSFFFASDLLLLTTLAFVVNLVPTLDSGLEKYCQ